MVVILLKRAVSRRSSITRDRASGSAQESHLHLRRLISCSNRSSEGVGGLRPPIFSAALGTCWHGSRTADCASSSTGLALCLLPMFGALRQLFKFCLYIEQGPLHHF